MRKIVCIILCGIVALLLTSCDSPERVESNAVTVTKTHQTRYPNMDNLSVGEYKLVSDGLVWNNEIVPIGFRTRSFGNTLSIIDGYAFFFDERGLGMYDLELGTWRKLYYDVMDNAVVGLNNIYYTVKVDWYYTVDKYGKAVRYSDIKPDDKIYGELQPTYEAYIMYALSSSREIKIFEEQVFSSYWLVVNNTLYYVTPGVVKALDLTTDTVEDALTFDTPINEFYTREGKLIVVTSNQSHQIELR